MNDKEVTKYIIVDNIKNALLYALPSLLLCLIISVFGLMVYAVLALLIFIILYCMDRNQIVIVEKMKNEFDDMKKQLADIQQQLDDNID